MRFSLPLVGLEPTHLTAQVPKTCMSTNFITRAWTQLRYPYSQIIQKLWFAVKLQYGHLFVVPRKWQRIPYAIRFSSLNPCYALSQNLSIHEQIRSLLDTLIHSVYNQHNLLFGVQMRFGWLYSHSKAPFLKHRSGKHVHTVYTQYKFGKFWLNVT